MTYLTKLKELCDKASPGPWSFSSIGPIVNDKNRKLVAHLNAESHTSILDAEFICESRTAIPRLIKALELAIEQRNEWAIGSDLFSSEVQDAEIEKILAGEK